MLRPFPLVRRAASALAVSAVPAGGLGFGIFYFHELNPWHAWPPETYVAIVDAFGPHAIIGLNILFVAGFLLALRWRRNTRHRWATRGLFAAFMISLVTEMFGLPLAAYLLSPAVSMPLLGKTYLQELGHWPVTLGAFLSFCGVAIILTAWVALFRARGALATQGIYRFVRHPQYSGFLIFTLGWLMHWPTVTTLVLWPFLCLSFVLAARAEEAELLQEYGAEYARYRAGTGAFLPRLLRRACPTGAVP